ncbi:MAG TPA: hypothetical protein V6C88_10835 [Chroococcidiopsis sp.]
MTKHFGWLMAAIALILLLQTAAIAQVPSSITARIARLESENTNLRSRLSRVETDLARLSRASGIEPSPAAPVVPSSAASSLADDPMFNRLATLVIELRERIVALEERIGSPTQRGT